MTSLVDFDISNNPGIDQPELNATIHTVTSSPYITSIRLSNTNISDLNYVFTPLLDAGKQRDYGEIQSICDQSLV